MGECDADNALDAFYAELKEVEETAKREEEVGAASALHREEKQENKPSAISATATIARSAALKTPEDIASERREALPPLPPPPVPPPVASPPAGALLGPTAGPLTNEQRTGVVRKAAGKTWVDTQLLEWPENDFRIFVGNLGTEVNDSMLSAAFKRYASFEMAKVMKTKDDKTRGYGFVSLGSAQDGAAALREMQGQYVGSRPVLVKKAAVAARTVKDKRGVPVTKTVNTKKRKNHIGGR